MRKSLCERSVAEFFAHEQLFGLSHYIALVGHQDDGKSSVLKLLIAELYRRDPSSWNEKQRYNPNRAKVQGAQLGISANKTVLEGDYHGSFIYRGVRIAIWTTGDATRYMLEGFKFFAKYQAQIAIAAVRVHNKGRPDTVMERELVRAQEIVGFESHRIEITGRKIRDIKMSMKIVNEIIKEIDFIIDGMK